MGEIHESSFIYDTDYTSVLQDISLFGRAVRKKWKTTSPQKYIYYLKHGFWKSPFPPSELTVYIDADTEYDYHPTYEDKEAKDWLPYYDSKYDLKRLFIIVSRSQHEIK